MKVSLVAMGMGTSLSLTGEAFSALQSADAIAGAARLLEGLPEDLTGVRLAGTKPREILGWIDAHPEWKHVCVAFSGDVGFYSGAATLLPLLANHETRCIPGVSTVQYFAARLTRPWKDMKLVSLHGREADPVPEVLNHREVFFLTGTNMPAQEVCRRLAEAGLGEAAVTVGQRLSYPDEKLVTGTAEQLVEQEFDPLSVMLVQNEESFRWPWATAGIPDEEFIRGKAPMTKQEVRVAALAKLRLAPGDTAYDIGAGTGSVAVEMAMQARLGRVYAIENNAEAVLLTIRNKAKFGAYNMTIVEGPAPEYLAELPPPAAAFIGGSKGNLEAIVDALLEKNPAVRLCISAVSLETLNTAVALLKTKPLKNTEVCQIAVSHGVAAGSYTLLRAANPIFLLSGEGAADE